LYPTAKTKKMNIKPNHTKKKSTEVPLGLLHNVIQEM